MAARPRRSLLACRADWVPVRPAVISVAGYARRRAAAAVRGSEACPGAMVLSLDRGLGVQ
jgi:hypothetical protein